MAPCVNFAFFFHLLLNIIFPVIIYAEDTITGFNENWAANFVVNYNIGVLRISDSPEYTTNKPFDIGLGIRYKDFSASVSVPVQFDNPFNTWLFDINVDSYFDKVYYKAYFK
jgi:hypothetical protein